MDSASKAPIRAGEVTIDFLVDADDSGGSVTVFECGVPRREGEVAQPRRRTGQMAQLSCEQQSRAASSVAR
jgi:hypothetical protein